MKKSKNNNKTHTHTDNFHSEYLSQFNRDRLVSRNGLLSGLTPDHFLNSRHRISERILSVLIRIPMNLDGVTFPEIASHEINWFNCHDRRDDNIRIFDTLIKLCHVRRYYPIG